MNNVGLIDILNLCGKGLNERRNPSFVKGSFSVKPNPEKAIPSGTCSGFSVLICKADLHRLDEEIGNQKPWARKLRGFQSVSNPNQETKKAETKKAEAKKEAQVR